MKHVSADALRQGQSIASNQPVHLIMICLLIAISFTSCQKDVSSSGTEAQTAVSKKLEGNAVNLYTNMDEQTSWELQQVRAATAKYRNIENAIKDGYQDIAVDVEEMGHHYMRMDLVDGKFELTKPELLVYNRDENGQQQLVAAEYAVPINEPEPQGFTGSADVWQHNTFFNLWLLHAWVWSYNPSGVFNPTNPLIHLH